MRPELIIEVSNGENCDASPDGDAKAKDPAEEKCEWIPYEFRFVCMYVCLMCVYICVCVYDAKAKDPAEDKCGCTYIHTYIHTYNTHHMQI